jgi:TolB-like protein/Tfp pilus assembly protein PilF/predicted Ser/Thr protein kinase
MIGETLGHYRILEKLGSGGMGEVYRARDEQLGREVALKVLPAQLLADDSARKLLIREARTASALNHPNICTIHDVGETEGRNYIVMEYVKGRPLAEQIGEGGLPAEKVIRYGEQISDGLAHAHEHGVIHRDLKTSNIMITPEGRVKVLDFGLAKRHAIEGVTEQTHSHNSKGVAGAGAPTMHYTAPEVFRGEATDARSDIWALGVVLYEMAAGQRPFHGNTAYELSSHILHDQPKELPATATPGLREVILKCLTKLPSERYQHAIEVRAALGALRSQTPSAVASMNLVQETAARLRGRRRVFILAGGFGAVLLLIAGWRFAPAKWKPGISGGGAIHSLAVLPLENLSRDPAEEYFADGMTEELTTQLAQISALRVISRTSVMQYKDTKKSLPQVAKELQVEAVVEGSVMRSGNRVRITAQLIQASTDKHLWAKSYEGDARDVLGLQQEVAHAIADEVKVQLTPQEQTRLSSSRPVNPAAHEAYLKGSYLNKGTGTQQRKAKEYFEGAIRIDSNYASAYAGLADYYWSTLDLRPRESMPKAKENALKALELDPDLAQAHTELAAIHFYGDWDWTGAEKEFRRALELNPGDADSHRYYSFVLAALGRENEAVAESRKAQELDPLSISTQVNAGFVLYYTREFDKAIEQCRKALDLDPNSAGAYDCLGSSYLAEGKYEEAIVACEKASSLWNDDPQRLVGLGRAYALADRKSEALRILEQLRQLSRHAYVPPYFFAAIYTAMGQKDEALRWLENAYGERDVYLAWLKADSAVDRLRDDARFQQLLLRVGFTN